MNVEISIKSLLLHNKFVIIPSIGGFKADYQAAKMDIEKKILLPPTYEISFNSKTRSDDQQLLSDFIIKEKHITKEDADKNIQDFVSSIETKINSGESFIIEGIGKLKKSVSNEIDYVAIEGANVFDTYAGFVAIDLPQKPISTSILKEATKSEPKIEAPIIKPIIAKKKKKAFSFFWILLALFFVIGGILFFSLHKNETEIVLAPVVIEEELIVEDSDSIFDGVSDTSYYIVAGSFQKRQNADMMLADLETQGYQVSIIGGENDFFRVIIYSSSQREDALGELEKARNNGMLRAWIFKEFKQ